LVYCVKKNLATLGVEARECFSFLSHTERNLDFDFSNSVPEWRALLFRMMDAFQRALQGLPFFLSCRLWPKHVSTLKGAKPR
jgi:hypothetical protein